MTVKLNESSKHCRKRVCREAPGRGRATEGRGSFDGGRLLAEAGERLESASHSLDETTSLGL